MREARSYEHKAVCVSPEDCVLDVADLMDADAIGCVVVVDDEERPVGVITDRDLTVRVVAAGRDPAKTTAADIMSGDVLSADRHATTVEVLQKLEARGVRRAPLLVDGKVVSLISLDDLIADVGAQLWNLAETVRVELRESRRQAPIRRRREARGELLEDLGTQLGELGEQARERIESVGRDIADRLSRLRP
jgi:signal-transduction protein with cAMP-binding, CBS, and nucleotidyltransferase domain